MVEVLLSFDCFYPEIKYLNALLISSFQVK